jgi:hypothetical protein
MQGTPAKNQKEKDGKGEVTSPAKPKPNPRQRKPRATFGKAASVVKGDITRISGQKRKEYRPKAPVPPADDDAMNPSTEVPSRALALVTTVSRATEDSGENQVADSDATANKKTRLANPVATAEQSRLTQ